MICLLSNPQVFVLMCIIKRWISDLRLALLFDGAFLFFEVLPKNRHIQCFVHFYILRGLPQVFTSDHCGI